MSQALLSNSSIWRPFTQMKTGEPPLSVRSGNGIELTLADGSVVLDLISSWWVTLHGHSHPAIAEAIYEQACQLEQVIFAGFTHEPAENLAQGLLQLLPKDLKHVFFSDNGSTATEVALKMAYQYWLNQGQKRTGYIGFSGGYHGDTIGAMSLGKDSGFWSPFSSLMFDIDTVPYPSVCLASQDAQPKEAATLEAIKLLLEDKPNQHAAIVIEPLIQGVAGMHMCRPEFLQQLTNLAHSYGVLIIFDEVMTGFGRTGDWFACTKSNTCPDIICLAKGITGGFLPLAVTITVDKVYDSFYSDDPAKALYHGHSYTGNPIACAAAIVSLKLLTENPDSFRRLESLHHKFITKHLKHNDRLINTRVCGTIAALDVITNQAPGYFNQVSPQLRKAFLERGLLIRPLGNTIYLMPPYCITEGELDHAYQVIDEVTQQL